MVTNVYIICTQVYFVSESASPNSIAVLPHSGWLETGDASTSIPPISTQVFPYFQQVATAPCETWLKDQQDCSKSTTYETMAYFRDMSKNTKAWLQQIEVGSVLHQDLKYKYNRVATVRENVREKKSEWMVNIIQCKAGQVFQLAGESNPQFTKLAEKCMVVLYQARDAEGVNTSTQCNL